MNLALIGYRGTGKSTVARLLAERLGWTAIDTDQQIEEAAGKSIAAIFADDGEPEFRRWESQIIARQLGVDSHVLALGGGAVIDPANRALARKIGKIVWLTAEPETLWRRAQSDALSSSRRPNLTTGGGLAEIIAILKLRTPIYRECADLEVDTEGK